MSALPELPAIPLLRTGQVQIRYFTLEELQKYATEYGDARAAHARKVAMGEAAKVLRGSDLSGLKDDQYLLQYTVQLLTTMATYLESIN